jgi:hypothetical protein
MSAISPEDQILATRIQKYMSRIESLATDMCYSIAFFFIVGNGDGVDHSKLLHTELSPMTATLLAWPLTLAVSTGFAQKAQKAWLQEKLDLISIVLGSNILGAVQKAAVDF